MRYVKTEMEGLIEICPEIFLDNRGHFVETYNELEFADNGINCNFVKDVESLSKKDVIRGLHFQKPPFAQGKLVRVVNGSIRDVVVDLRGESKTHGQWRSFDLNAENRKMLWIPEGFAHGFLSLEDETLVQYKLTSHYDKPSERGIVWNDPDLHIDWGSGRYIISDKDSKLPKFKDLERAF